MTVLIVCTGNVCRSPAAELLLNEHLGSAAMHYSLRSAGIRAAPGIPIDATIGAMLGGRGIEAAHCSARRVDAGMLESADLILTASTSNRSAVTRMLPAAVRKTFTLKQLARYAPCILDHGEGPVDAVDRIPWILAEVPLARARAPRQDDSIADPLGRSRRRYRAAFNEIDRACVAVAALLGAPLALPSDATRGWWSEMSAVET